MAKKKKEKDILIDVGQSKTHRNLPRKVVPTMKQAKVVSYLLVGKVDSVSKAMRKAGYSKTMASKPSEKLLRTKGFKVALANAGLTDNFILRALKRDIERYEDDSLFEKRNRVQELKLASQISGLLGKEKEKQDFSAIQININMTDGGENLTI